MPKGRRPEGRNEHQGVADVGKQDPGEITLYVVDLLSTYPPFDRLITDRVVGIAESLRN
jgi:hypothetical protein